MASAREKKHFERVWQAAVAAGNAAFAAAEPVPMVVQQHASPLNDASPVVKSYYVADGVCGFAWVRIPKSNGKFARWLKDNKLARPGYPSGAEISSAKVAPVSQSLARNEAACQAAAEVLKAGGLECYADSRID